MKIVHAASELYPYIKTGGLADAVGALTGTFADKGHEVSVFLPGYRTALTHPGVEKAQRKFRLKIEMGDQFLSGDILAFSPRKNLTVYLVCREEFFDRRNPYGTGERDYEDNAERFTFFCKAVVETMRLADLGADIVHAHDWQAGLLPLLIREGERRFGVTLAMKTIFTIHNIAFQGLFPASTFAHTNLPEELFSMDGLEYYGQVNFLKGGILFADKVTTVSPRYAKEIQTPEFGCGLEGVIQTRVDDLSGILNGVDTAIWNPQADVLIPAPFSAANLAGKRACRDELLRHSGFAPGFTGPVFGMVCRLTEQKGIDLVLANADFFRTSAYRRLVVLGTGDKRMERELRELATSFPERIFMCARLDEAMSHLIEAGSDFFVMPSLFEPCGLNQMYSQVYGTVPIVSRVGGLVDTVRDVDADAAAGTGLTCDPTAPSLRDALERALVLFADGSRFAAVQQRDMARDFSCGRVRGGLYRDAMALYPVDAMVIVVSARARAWRLRFFRAQLGSSDAAQVEPNRMKILVAGASGLIGRAACAAFRADNHEVIRLVRREAVAGDELTWHPAAGELPLDACRKADAVVNLCGADLAAKRWTAKRRSEIRTSRIDSTQTLAKIFIGPGATAANRPGVFISASAIGIYGDRGNLELSESSGPGNGFLSDLCRDWEGAAMAAAESGARVVCARFGVVLSREGGLLPRVVPFYRAGLGCSLGTGPPVDELDRARGRRGRPSLCARRGGDRRPREPGLAESRSRMPA